MEIHFERQALYGEVWSTPLTTLGKKYGLSDNGLRKVCRALSIPLPRAGHWAKVEAGQVVDRIDLPEETERTHFVCRPPPKPSSDFSLPEDALWLAEKLRVEAQPANQIEINLSPVKWHPEVAPVRKELNQAASKYADLLRQKEVQDRNPRSRRTWEPDLLAMTLFNFSGGMLTPRHHKSSMRCTTATYERALAIANSLMFEGRKRGCKVSFDASAQRFCIELERAHFLFSLRERSGKLALVVERSGTNVEIVDGDLPVERRLGEIFPRLYRDVVKSREYFRQRTVELQEEAIAKAEKAERLALQEREVAVKAAEFEKRRALEADAAASEQAQMIRRYVDRVLTGQHEGNAQAAEWGAWARIVANDIDPVPGLRRRLGCGE